MALFYCPLSLNVEGKGWEEVSGDDKAGVWGSQEAVVCKLCTWVDSNTYKINEDVLPRSLQPLGQRMHMSR